jgi:tight adherence protein B
MPKRLLSLLLAALVTGALALIGGPATAADGAAIAHVKPTNSGVKILVSLPEGADVDLTGVEVSLAGKEAKASARSAASDAAIKRTTILVIDTSNSMKGDRFAAAQTAARSTPCPTTCTSASRRSPARSSSPSRRRSTGIRLVPCSTG